MARFPSLSRKVFSGAFAALTASWLAGPSCASAQQAVDCDALVHSNMPFVLTTRGDRGGKYVSHVRRGDNLNVTITYRSGEKMGEKTLQANFVTSQSDGASDRRAYTYDVPTNKYWFERNRSLIIHSKVKKDDSISETEEKYTMLGDEDVTVGPCVVHTKHYSTELNDRVYGDTVRTEVWMALGLNVEVKSKFMFKAISNPKVIEISDEAVDISPEPPLAR